MKIVFISYLCRYLADSIYLFMSLQDIIITQMHCICDFFRQHYSREKVQNQKCSTENFNVQTSGGNNVQKRHRN